MQKIYLNNKWKDSKSINFFERKTFFKNKTYKYPNCNQEDLDDTISSAYKGLKKYKNTDLKYRSKLLMKVAIEIKKNYKIIAKLESEETGKKIENCENEVLHSANLWKFASKNIKQLKTQDVNLQNNKLGKVSYEAVGIVCLIIPWNFPFVVASERLPYILAAGNCAIIKPSEFASQSIIFLVKLLKKIKFPLGVINLIFGKGPSIGKKIVDNKNINMISFTGSTKIGKKIMEGSGKFIRRLSLELGGKNSIIILNDADLKKSASIAIDSFCLNTGQCCVATTKLIIEKNIKKKFVKILIKKLKNIDNFKEHFGPITTLSQFNKIHKILKKNKKFNKKIIFGDTKIRKDNYIFPIIYEDLPRNNIINQVEIFGPILSILSFNKDSQAIELANNTDYGLSAIICGKEKKRLNRIYKKIEAGRIWINESIKLNFPILPIGGFKQSGLNRECGNEGFKTYSEIKSLII